ncbi:MAG: ribulose-phosphate 3-epimerase, partial [Bacilli bacterium]
MNKILCPSMMCANFENLQEEIIKLDSAGIDMFHCDIMDGTFVPNFAMGLMDLKAIRKSTDKMIDCHLMIENPSSKIQWFIDAGADLIYIHPESEKYMSKTLMYIKNKNVKAGIAINPDTCVESLSEIFSYVDYVLVMTVNPGFAGQKFIETTLTKIKKLVIMKRKYKFKIVIDGACDFEVIRELSKIGCDGFVLGTSSLFNKGLDYKEQIDKIRIL